MDDRISQLLRNIDNTISSYDLCSDVHHIDNLIFQLQLLIRHMLVATIPDSIIEMLSMAVSVLTQMLDSATDLECLPPVAYHGGRGRPKIIITSRQLIQLLSIGFTCPGIADMIGVSLSTVRRRMSEYGLSIAALYTNISDTDLDQAVASIKRDYPNAGYRMMTGLLLQQGIRVQQSRLRESMHRVDPCGISIRWQESIKRRQYNVTQPLALWHIDGNHKLIRYDSTYT